MSLSLVPSIMRSFPATAVAVAAVIALLAQPAKANGISVGSQAFVDIATPTVNTGDINSSTAFTIGSLLSTTGLGVFSAMPAQNFGAVSFNISTPGSLTFGNSVFGNFVSTSFNEIANEPGTRTFLVLGDYTAGTYVGSVTPSPAPASFRIAFTQSPAGTGVISDSSTFSIPPEPVPEPSTMMLAGLGLGALVAVKVGRKRMRMTGSAA